MYFGLSEDQIFFQENVKKFLEDNAPIDVIRKIVNEVSIPIQIGGGIRSLERIEQLLSYGFIFDMRKHFLHC